MLWVGLPWTPNTHILAENGSDWRGRTYLQPFHNLRLSTWICIWIPQWHHGASEVFKAVLGLLQCCHNHRIGAIDQICALLWVNGNVEKVLTHRLQLDIV